MTVGIIPAGKTVERPRVSPTSLAITADLCKLADAVVIIISMSIACRSRALLPLDAIPTEPLMFPIALLAAVIFILLLHKADGYSVAKLTSFPQQAVRMTPAWLGAECAIFYILYSTHADRTDDLRFAVVWGAISLGLLYALRLVLACFFQRWRRLGALRRKIVVVGATETGAQIVTQLVSQPDRYQVLGIFDDRHERVPRQLHEVPVLGMVRDLLTFARSELPDEIIVTLPITQSNRLSTIFKTLTALPVDLRLTCEMIAPGFRLRDVGYIGETPVLDIYHRPLQNWGAVWKWLEDKIIASLALLILAPLLLLLALVVVLDSPGPVFFRQARFGFNNRVITVFKFRTMYCDEEDRSGARRTVPGDRRVTRIGHALRNLSFDELPQLFNVLRGDMSLVGPRAHAVAMEIDGRLYGDAVAEYFARHRVRPGLTGLAQINGLRGAVNDVESARKRVEYDLQYIENWSIWLDIKIMFKTVWVVLFKRDNAY